MQQPAKGTPYQGRIVKSATPAEPAAPVLTPQAAAMAEAAAEIDRMRAEAERQAEEIRVRALADSEAAVAERILAMTRQMQTEIDTVQPVLIDLVLDCVRKIVSDYPPQRLTTGLVRSGLAELKAEHGVVLYSPLEDYPALMDAVKELQGSATEPVQAVKIDSDLPTGRCRLQHGGITVEIGLKAQLAALEALLRPTVAPSEDDGTANG